jgi:hypothetical protein
VLFDYPGPCFPQLPRIIGGLLYSMIKIQGEHKRTLHFQNDTENKCGVLRTSHIHQSIEKLSEVCTHLTETRHVLHESHGRCREDNPRSKVASDTEGRSGLLFLQMNPFCSNFLYQE